jgi:predicted RNA binding protein YcfA (HicA-like mRNA interferase family)
MAQKAKVQTLRASFATETLGEMSERITAMKIRDIIKLIEADGWYRVDTRGSHRQYKHPIKSGRVTIAGHPNDDLAPGTLNSILKQAKLKEVK